MSFSELFERFEKECKEPYTFELRSKDGILTATLVGNFTVCMTNEKNETAIELHSSVLREYLRLSEISRITDGVDSVKVREHHHI